MPDIPQAALDAGARAIHADRCRHPFMHQCTGPSELDREYAAAVLTAAEAVWPHDPARRLQVVPHGT